MRCYRCADLLSECFVAIAALGADVSARQEPEHSAPACFDRHRLLNALTRISLVKLA